MAEIAMDIDTEKIRQTELSDLVQFVEGHLLSNPAYYNLLHDATVQAINDFKALEY
jgi:hypothetical protein